MTMTSSELLPSVMSATWTFRELGLLCQLYTPPFQQRTLVHPKPWQTVDAGVGFSFEPCIPTPAVFLLRRYTTKSASCSLAARHKLLGVPNIHRHSVTCVRIFLGHLPMHWACYRYVKDGQLFYLTRLFITRCRKRVQKRFITSSQTDHHNAFWTAAWRAQMTHWVHKAWILAHLQCWDCLMRSPR